MKSIEIVETRAEEISGRGHPQHNTTAKKEKERWWIAILLRLQLNFYCFQLRELKSDDESKFPVPSGSLTRAHDGCFPLQVVQCSHRREEPIFSQTVCTSISPGRDPENRARCRRGHRPKES